MPGPVSATLTAKAIGDGGAHTYLSGVCELDRVPDEISHRRRGLNGIAIQCNVRGRTPVVHWCFTALTSLARRSPTSPPPGFGGARPEARHEARQGTLLR